jgi:signal recognition particle subunit SRP14
MVLLENDAFLTELTKLYERTRAKGSVSCVMKITKPTNKPRPKGTKRPDPTLEEIRAPGSEYGVLVRASDGKRKVSTFVKPEKASKFSKSYQTIQLAYLDGLSAETKKKKKKKPTAKAKKPTAKAKTPVEESTSTSAAKEPAPAPAPAKPKPTATANPKPKPPPGAKGAKKKGAGARK